MFMQYGVYKRNVTLPILCIETFFRDISFNVHYCLYNNITISLIQTLNENFNTRRIKFSL